MTDIVAAQMAGGGWNLVWCGESELDLVARHNLRAQLHDPLLSPASVDDMAQRKKLDELVARVRSHPALYSYFITDEPNAKDFRALGRLVTYLRTIDPDHLAYINLFPTYATNEQLGNKGATVPAYEEHLRHYVDIVNPGLISYDHYQFTVKGDSPDYFLNLSLIRQAAQKADVPFLNIVQACTWTSSMRVPNENEMRYLVYTTAAYGAQGISYYVYCCAGHTGGIANSNGTPTALYGALKSLNREFVRIVRELQPLRSLSIYHAGMLPPGTEPVPKDAAFSIDPPLPAIGFEPPEPTRGVILGYFGPKPKKGKAGPPTHCVVVNLDYHSPVVVPLRSRAKLDLFDAETGAWSKTREKLADLHLPPGGGKLVRMR
jgi:hypothetical protein